MGVSRGLAAVGALAALGAVPGRYGVASGALSSAVGAARSATLGFRASALIGVARLAVLTASAALFVLLVWVLVAASAAGLVARRRHRILLPLLAHGDPKVPRALGVAHPAPAPASIPRPPPRILIHPP